MLAEIKTFLIAMSPVLELRGSIPIALEVYHLPVLSAFIFSFLGNIFPVPFFLLLFESVSGFLIRKIHFFNRFFSWIFEKTRKNHEKKFEKWRNFALFILVAIPLPFTGAWTGLLCAFIFRIPFKQAFPLISAGVAVAGIIVLILTLGIIKII